MKIENRALLTRILFILLLASFTQLILSSFMQSWNIYAGGMIPPINQKKFFILVGYLVIFLTFWNVLKTEYILLASGIILFYGAFYIPLARPILKIFQSIGLLLYLVAMFRMFFYLISKKSNKFFINKMSGHLDYDTTKVSSAFEKFSYNYSKFMTRKKLCFFVVISFLVGIILAKLGILPLRHPYE